MGSIGRWLFQCWATIYDADPTLDQCIVCCDAEEARVVDPMLFQCWATVADSGPTLKQHCISVSCDINTGGASD